MNTDQPSHRSPDGTQERVYNHPADRFWALYLADADKRDTEMTENMKGDTDGILIFTGLFAATVAAFIIEFYKTLNADSGDDTVAVLSGISNQISAISNGTRGPPTSPNSFRAPTASVRINSLWFISLFLSVYVALASTLVQQWCRRYLRAARHRGPPHKRGPIHVVVSKAMKQFHVEHAVEIIIALLHLSVFLFLGGLLDFLFVINPSVAHAFIPFLAAGAIAYFGLTVLPFFFPSSPYDTPLTHLARLFLAGASLLMSVTLLMAKRIELLVLPWLLRLLSSAKPSQFLKKWAPRAGQLAPGLYRSRKRVLKQLGSSPSEEDIFYSLHMTLKVLDEEAEIEEFFAGLPGFLQSRFVEGMAPQTAVYLIRQQNILESMLRLMRSCIRRSLFSESKATRRVETVLGALQSILPCVMTSVEALDSLRNTGDEREAIAPLIGAVIRYVMDMRSKQDTLVTVRRIGAYARLKDTVMSRILSNDSIGSDPLRDQYVENILYYVEISYPRVVFSDLPLKKTIRREKCLANVNTHIHAIALALGDDDDLRNSMDRNRYAEDVSRTLNQLYSSLTRAYRAENGRLSQQHVDEFARNWRVIRRSQEFQRYLSHTGQQDAAAVKLFRTLRACARLILPLATPPNPLVTRLPPSTDSEEQYLEGDDGHKLQPAIVVRPPDTYAVYPDGYADMPVFRVGHPGEEAPKESIPTRKEDSEVKEERSHRADKDDGRKKHENEPNEPPEDGAGGVEVVVIPRDDDHWVVRN